MSKKKKRKHRSRCFITLYKHAGNSKPRMIAKTMLHSIFSIRKKWCLLSERYCTSNALYCKIFEIEISLTYGGAAMRDLGVHDAI